MKQYIVGNIVELKATFKTEEGDLVDPTEVMVEIRLPDLTVEDLTSQVVHVSTGFYILQYVPMQNGLYEYKFLATGPVAQEPIAAGERSFTAQTFFPS